VLVDDLVDATRVQLDEAVTADLSDEKILGALNRAQQKLVRLATRHYSAMFKREATVQADSDSRHFTIPEQAFGLIVNQVECVVGGVTYKVAAAELQQLTEHENESTVTIPSWYAQMGNKLKVFPKTSSPLRIRYQVRPPDLVKSQGRVTSMDTGTVSVTLDVVGSGLTTSIASLGAFVNWVDGTTGLVKATLQVASLDSDTGEVVFKTTGLDRTTVFGLTVATALPTDAALDDYLAPARGTCVPTLVSDYADYLVQFAVVELKRKNGEGVSEELVALKDLEDDIKLMWAGREPSRRVQRSNPYWGSRVPLIQRYR
jgi:hypothetical protein